MSSSSRTFFLAVGQLDPGLPGVSYLILHRSSACFKSLVIADRHDHLARVWAGLPASIFNRDPWRVACSRCFPCCGYYAKARIQGRGQSCYCVHFWPRMLVSCWCWSLWSLDLFNAQTGCFSLGQLVGRLSATSYRICKNQVPVVNKIAHP